MIDFAFPSTLLVQPLVPRGAATIEVPAVLTRVSLRIPTVGVRQEAALGAVVPRLA